MEKMKFISLGIPILGVPRKFGFDPLSAAASVGMDAISSFGTGLIGTGMDAIGLDSQKNFAREQMAWQSQENQLNRDFQSLEAEKARQYNTSERIASQDWNSAANQVKRLGEAGINPATAFGSSAGSAGSSTPGSQGALPQGSASVSAPNAFSPLQMMAQAGTIKNLASAYKDTQQGTTERELLGARLKEVLGNARSIELRNQIDETTANIVKRTGRTQESAKIEALLMQAALDAQRVETEISKKKLTDAEFNTEIQRRLSIIFENVGRQIQNDIGRVNYKKALIDLKFYQSTLEESIKTMRSEQSRNYASAQESRSHASLYDAEKLTEDIMRHPRKVAQDIANRIADGNLDLQELEKAIKKCDLSVSEARALKAALEKERDSDVRMFRDKSVAHRSFDSVMHMISSSVGVSVSN